MTILLVQLSFSLESETFSHFSSFDLEIIWTVDADWRERKNVKRRIRDFIADCYAENFGTVDFEWESRETGEDKLKRFLAGL